MLLGLWVDREFSPKDKLSLSGMKRDDADLPRPSAGARVPALQMQTQQTKAQSPTLTHSHSGGLQTHCYIMPNDDIHHYNKEPLSFGLKAAVYFHVPWAALPWVKLYVAENPVDSSSLSATNFIQR